MVVPAPDHQDKPRSEKAENRKGCFSTINFAHNSADRDETGDSTQCAKYGLGLKQKIRARKIKKFKPASGEALSHDLVRQFQREQLPFAAAIAPARFSNSDSLSR